MAAISFSSTDDRISQIDAFVKTGTYPDRSTFINISLDHMFKSIESKRILDFMYFVSIPFLFFLITLGITLYFGSLFFYVLSSVSGVYLIVFFYLFYNKYRGV